MEASFDPQSFKALKAKTLIVASDKLAAPQDEILSKTFAKLVAAEEFMILPDSRHMTFLQACKPNVKFDDPELIILCADGEKKLHLQQIIKEKILQFFRSNL
jgi:predicted dienelactone hydrolase